MLLKVVLHRSIGSTRLLRVLHCQANGAARHGLLRASEKGQPSFLLASVPPHRHANDFLGLHQILPRWTWNFHRRHQLIRSHRHVLLLHARSDGTRIPKVLVVETLDHKLANGA